MKFLIVIIILFSIVSFSQGISSGYYVVPSADMTPDSKSYLENKLKTALMNAGINAVDSYYPVVTAIHFIESETIELEGIRKSYKTIGELFIHVLFENSEQDLSSTSVSIEGVGKTKTIAINNAIKNIKIPQQQLVDLLNTAKVNYKPALDNYSAIKMKEVRNLYSNGNESDAMLVASEIPIESKYYKEAVGIISKIKSQRMERQKKYEEQQQLAKEQKQYEREKEMRFALEKMKIEEDNISKQQKTVNRSRIDEGFGKLWNKIFGKS